MKSTYQMKGYSLHVMPSKKFKNITISFRMKNLLTRETTSLRTLLAFVLVGATAKFPKQTELSRYLEEMYGARLSVNISSKGKSQVISINCGCVNEEFLPTHEDLLGKQLELLHDVLLDPQLIEGAFDESIVELKKKEIIERLKANKDDKFSYSLDKLFEYMGRDSSLGISSTGYEKDVESITAKQLYDYYLECIKNDDKHVYIVGDIDESVVTQFENAISFSSEETVDCPTSYIFNDHKQNVVEVIEQQEIVQSKLNLGYTINCDFVSKNHDIFTVFNGLFGGFSQSRLFKIVREKNSLCYYVSSSYDAFNGIMIVNAGIEMKDYQKTLELIAKQLKEIQDGQFEENELMIIKNLLISSLNKSNDEPSSMIAMAYNRDITHKQETIEEYKDKLLHVTKEDVVKVAKLVKLDTIYFLTGKDFYENNSI